MALDCGVSILPMVAFHVGQLLLDTFIADAIRKGNPKENAIAASGNAQDSRLPS
jgi:hypothetical protein